MNARPHPGSLLQEKLPRIFIALCGSIIPSPGGAKDNSPGQASIASATLGDGTPIIFSLSSRGGRRGSGRGGFDRGRFIGTVKPPCAPKLHQLPLRSPLLPGLCLYPSKLSEN